MNGSHLYGLTASSSVMIHDLNVVRLDLPLPPLETYAPRLVDTNGVLAGTTAF